ncbi:MULTISPECIES: Bpu10I family restriction endonuclease [Bacillus subtilis group]|uniref:Bpu10I family restriction endonuclease n=1 Tax=Bacillus subtilis group TaxID=653685 RepID=UPI0000E1D3A7|nr:MULTISPECIES: Bpu10I family restriction endonuclease [Bacillus subtilis group]AGE65699.1 hypothetical protein C663_4009 [Bacillus subtilis XF-1]AKD37305.1 hypothetical protein AW03_039380 [Bacillus subtilis HJ5]ALS83817.1 restriction endonuclease [Bacillus subtilis subsp. subtilis]ASK26167.1 hypothetical protein BSSX_4307 [Bacillus subtilis]MCL9627696.1 Bpu10I family restriction endonuclease [Bacillus subtilis]
MTTYIYPTPHKDKLVALLLNDKLPVEDKPRVEEAIVVYTNWIKNLNIITSAGLPPQQTLNKMIELLNEYKFYIDLNLVFDSPRDFLYRQKGQLKIDNTIIEEFLPRLAHPSVIPEIIDMDVTVGPKKCFSSVYFESSLDAPAIGGGLRVRSKDQDFAISKKLFLKASHTQDYKESLETETFLSYVSAECKTNLDKTMFQEGCATAHDTKVAVPGSKYFLLCEWLDMTPLSTAPTDIDEILLLRKAKRLNSNIRKKFSSYSGRQEKRDYFINYLKSHPFRVEVFERFIEHIRKLIQNEVPVEHNVMELGYF